MIHGDLMCWNEKNEERKDEGKMMKEKKEKPWTNHLKNYIEYQVKN
jgi:hypothetical protein